MHLDLRPKAKLSLQIDHVIGDHDAEVPGKRRGQKRTGIHPQKSKREKREHASAMGTKDKSALNFS